uniref:Endonuclease/exonuclease/phosphatase domain-containing protein n=1 Tax=Romanomermis culicivorax TaxID=13658 RepID=A0A915I4S8_ROMCU
MLSDGTCNVSLTHQSLDQTARASSVGDAHRSRPSGVRNQQGLAAHGRGGLKKRAQLRVGTINIGTMTGKSRELANDFKTRHIDIACIQGTKWKGAKAREIGEGFKLFYNGERQTQNGIGILVSDQLRDSVVEVNQISDWLMSIKLDSEVALRVASCYAPQTKCSDGEKDKFWNSLDAHLQSFEPSDHLAIIGDLNRHVRSTRDGCDEHHSGHGFGNRNNDGSRILDWVEAHDFTVTNTFFKRRPTHLITYDRGVQATQIDYSLFRRRDHKLSVHVTLNSKILWVNKRNIIETSLAEGKIMNTTVNA